MLKTAKLFIFASFGDRSEFWYVQIKVAASNKTKALIVKCEPTLTLHSRYFLNFAVVEAL